MATLRRTNLAHLLIVAACSSTDPSTSSNGIQGVSVLDNDNNCNDSQCINENTAGAALVSGALWLTRTKSTSPSNCNGNCTNTYNAQFGLATFGADGGMSLLETTPAYTTTNNGNGISSDVGATGDGAQVYFAYNDPNANQLVVQAGIDGGTQQVSPPGGAQGAIVLGVAAQPESAIVATQPTCCGNNCTQPYGCGGGNIDMSNGSINFDNNPSDNDAGAVLYALNFADGGVMQQAIGVDTRASTHMFTTDGSNAYWIGGGSVWSMPVDLSAPPMSIAQVSDVPEAMAASNGVVAWSSIQGTSQCTQNGPCTFTPQSYSISTASGTIYAVTSTTQFCLGLAIDTKYAYFAEHLHDGHRAHLARRAPVADAVRRAVQHRSHVRPAPLPRGRHVRLRDRPSLRPSHREAQRRLEVTSGKDVRDVDLEPSEHVRQEPLLANPVRHEALALAYDLDDRARLPVGEPVLAHARALVSLALFAPVALGGPGGENLDDEIRYDDEELAFLRSRGRGPTLARDEAHVGLEGVAGREVEALARPEYKTQAMSSDERRDDQVEVTLDGAMGVTSGRIHDDSAVEELVAVDVAPTLMGPNPCRELGLRHLSRGCERYLQWRRHALMVAE